MIAFRSQKRLGHAQICLLQGFNSKFPTSIPTPFIFGVSPPPPGVVAVMQFFSKNRANFVKVKAILKRLARELSLLSWTSRPLFAHFINFSKGVYLILPLKRFGIFKRFIFGVQSIRIVLANNESHPSTYTINTSDGQPPTFPPPKKKLVQGKIFPQKKSV